MSNRTIKRNWKQSRLTEKNQQLRWPLLYCVICWDRWKRITSGHFLDRGSVRPRWRGAAAARRLMTCGGSSTPKRSPSTRSHFFFFFPSALTFTRSHFFPCMRQPSWTGTHCWDLNNPIPGMKEPFWGLSLFLAKQTFAVHVWPFFFSWVFLLTRHALI